MSTPSHSKSKDINSQEYMPIKSVPNLRRYLVPFNTATLPTSSIDIVVVGSGAAGLTAAIEAAKTHRVLLITKDAKHECSSFYSQGGIASALSKYDSVALHIQDTLKVGSGISQKKMVEIVIKEGLDCIKELIGKGMHFDKVGEDFAFAREGSHSLARILHVGDKTGSALELTLLKIAESNKNINIMENTMAIDLITKNNSCLGILVHTKGEGLKVIYSLKTILATGGICQIYRETTNPKIATGDGIAMAYRAGASLQDLEFVQFHPTTLYLAGASRALISEAVRGEGAKLIDNKGRTFMNNYHPLGDLAPRDIVSRAILKQMKLTNDTQVYLRLPPWKKEKIEEKFPTLWDLCKKFRLNIPKDPIPVRPSAHYMIGGIKIDSWGATNIENLYACGEVAASGFHGANRLASNSLLECLVSGKRAGIAATESRTTKKIPHPSLNISINSRQPAGGINLEDMKNSLKSLMWQYVGIERNEEGLKFALRKMRFWSNYIMEAIFENPDGWEVQNMTQIAILIAQSALLRKESRGVHFRTDFPKTDDKNYKRHIIVKFVK